MKQLARFEANLLRIVHGVLQRAPLEKVHALLTGKEDRPTCLSRPAVELLQDTLAKGTVALLAREGWRRQRFVRGPGIVAGRLWQRTPAAELGLAFSRHSLAFLIWLTAWNRQDKQTPEVPPDDELSMGDRWLHFLTYRFFHDTDVGTALRKVEFIAANGMCRLMFPDDFAEVKRVPAPHWKYWTNGVGSCILESSQTLLAKRWIDMEVKKRELTSPARMSAIGQSQESTLAAFLEAVSSVGRRDLAGFLLAALGSILTDSPSAQRWIGALKTDGLRLNERLEARRAALAYLRQLAILQAWDAEARTVGFFDDGYAASQLWKADWEKHDGDELCRRAQLVLREVEPL